MKTSTGEIKALINLTSDTINKSYKEDYNYAFFKQIEPGTLFSVASLMALTDLSDISLNDTIDTGTGVCEIYGMTIKDANEGGWGNIPLYKAFYVNSNVGIAKTVYSHFKNEPDKLINQLKTYNLDKSIGVDSAEPSPLIKNTSHPSWSTHSLPMTALGYECSFTPCQLLVFYNTIATNGRRIKPITEKNDTLSLPLVLNDAVFSEKALYTARQLLDSTHLGPMKVALNTGTTFSGHASTTVNISNNYDEKTYTHSLCAFFPSDKPEYTIIVVCNKNEHTYINPCLSVLSRTFEAIKK